MQNTQERKGRVGRPATGKAFPIAVRTYENEEGVALLNALAERRGVSLAALLRQLVREEAARRGIRRSDWSVQAAEAAEYYRTHPDARSELEEWAELPDGYREGSA